MSKKQFTTESERINSTYSIRILKDGEVIFEVSNWNSLSTMHKRECEDIVDLLNELNGENEQLKQENTQFKILVNELKNQNQKLKGRLNDLGVEYYD